MRDPRNTSGEFRADLVGHGVELPARDASQHSLDVVDLAPVGGLPRRRVAHRVVEELGVDHGFAETAAPPPAPLDDRRLRAEIASLLGLAPVEEAMRTMRSGSTVSGGKTLGCARGER